MARRKGRRAIAAAELGQKLGISPRSARRYWAEPRRNYEVESRENYAPWNDEGISRATWYRRRQRGRQKGKDLGGGSPSDADAKVEPDD